MKKHLILLLVLILSVYTTLYSQKDQGYLEVKGTVKVDREGLSGAKINLYKNGTKDKVFIADDAGRFEFRLDLNSNYDLVFSKRGYFSKKLFFNTHVPPEDVGIWNYKFAIELIPEIEGFNASLFNEPIGKFEFNDRMGDFDYDEVYTSNMQKRIKALMAEYEKARREAFKKLIAQADDFFNNKDYDQAIEFYDKAIDLDPFDPYPDDQIFMIGKIIQKDQNVEKNYQKNIELADQHFRDEFYGNAQKYYQRAIKYKNEKYPNDQLALIETLLNQEEDDGGEKLYVQTIAAADRLFQSQQYQPSLDKYNEALGIKPNETYPKERITEITAIMAQLEKDKNSREQLEKEYNQTIMLADSRFDAKDLTTARTHYLKASQLKPAETYPRIRLTEIENLLAAQKSNEEKYRQFIAVADASFTAQQYESAKNNYQLALSMKPAEAYPTKRINEIDALLMQLTQMRKQELDEAYNKALAVADAAFNRKAYNEAKNSYQQALNLKKEEAYPQQKLNEIEQQLALKANKKRAYDVAIARADNNFNIENWELAKSDYQEAQAILPDEQYPQTRITEINNKLLAIKSAENQRVAQQKSEAEYNALVAQADALFNSQQWEQAKRLYQQALVVIPDKVYPKQRITEIDNTLTLLAERNKRYNDAIFMADAKLAQNSYGEALTAYNQAAQLKPDETYPKQKISEIQVLLENQRKNQVAYDNYIKLADAAFSSNQLETARLNYQSALSLKVNEAYPLQRIGEIDKLMAEQLASKEARARIDEQYKTYLASADKNFSQQQLQEAKNFYTQASGLKPNEAYPKQRLEEIDVLMAAQQANQQAYETRINEGAARYNQKNYKGALESYQQAAQIKPDEPFPKQKITELQGLLANEAQMQQQYQQWITQADLLFNQNKYNEAKNVYQQASNLMPGQEYPKNQLLRINQLMADAARRDATSQAQLKAYNAKIEEADLFFDAQRYDQAISSYNAAKKLKPDETYPDQQIARINQLIQNASAQLDRDFNQAILQGDQFKQQRNYEQARQQYNKALNLKPQDPLPQSKLIELQNLIDEERLAAERQNKTDADYANYLNRADKAFKIEDYSSALALYKGAQNIKPAESYPKNQILACERKIQELQARAIADEEKRKQAELAAAKSTFKGKDFDYSGETRDQRFLSELSKQYPEGVTVENYDKPNKKITRVIVNHDGIAKEYIKVVYSYGTFYFRNGQNISGSVFNSETKE
ncbi:MAG: hypothetical protein CVU09_01040 [Bacteroidetes bacterium HGW-Bacteroidetes-4]|jgi:tetratricopeptide (TPR) repeat protein|nr:MAG: hypothetical protein CVU09_01040 [Bacteroidetes bacterium HGW-Bacteroidetes-4]